MGYRTIPVKSDTYESLKKLKSKYGSFDRVIRILLSVYEKHNSEEEERKAIKILCNELHGIIKSSNPIAWIRLMRKYGIDPEIGFRFLKPLESRPGVFVLDEEVCINAGYGVDRG